MYNSLNNPNSCQPLPTRATITARVAHVLRPGAEHIALSYGDSVTILCRVPRHRLYVKVQTAAGEVGYLFTHHFEVK